MNKFRKLGYSLVLVAITALVSSYFTRFGVYNWYGVLDKPSFTPPDYTFRIVWTILYLLMVMSFYLIQIKSTETQYINSARIFINQLFLQIIWTFAFFYMGFIGIALAIIILLDFVAWRMIKNFQKIDLLAGRLLYPYFLWLLYATYLNFSFVYLNGLIVEI